MALDGSYFQDVALREWALAYLSPRYLSLGIHAFVAFYVGFKFLFLVFNATDILERWVFELTPAFLRGLPELQLALLSAVAAGTNVFLHYAHPRRARFLGILLTGLMVASLVLALRTSPYYFDAVNLARLTVLGALLATVPLDHLGLMRREAPWPEEPLYEEVGAPYPMEPAWGPPEPAAFDDAMSSVDEALSLLGGAQEGSTSQEEMADLATDLLEELLAVFEEGEEVEEQPPSRDPAEAQRRQALFQRRIQSIDRRLQADPEDADALFAKGTYLAMQKRHQEAIEVLDRVTQLNPRYPGVWYFKAKVHQALGNLKMAELCLNRAAQLESEE